MWRERNQNICSVPYCLSTETLNFKVLQRKKKTILSLLGFQLNFYVREKCQNEREEYTEVKRQRKNCKMLKYVYVRVHVYSTLFWLLQLWQSSQNEIANTLVIGSSLNSQNKFLFRYITYCSNVFNVKKH